MADEDSALSIFDRQNALERRGNPIPIILTVVVGLMTVLTSATDFGEDFKVGFYNPSMLHLDFSNFVREFASATGTLVGVALVLLGIAMYKRWETGWTLTIILFPIAALHGLILKGVLSLALVFLPLLGIPYMVRERKREGYSFGLTRSQTGALITVLGLLVYGTTGSYVLRHSFRDINHPLDGLYYTIVTSSTVGYGGATPTTPMAKTYTITLIIFGTIGFGYAAATLARPLLEARLKNALGRMTHSQLKKLDNHIIVLGYDEMSDSIISSLGSDSDVIVISRDSDQVEKLQKEGNLKVFEAEPADQDNLQKAKIDKAKAVIVATGNDAEDTLSVITARQLNNDVRIVAGANNQQNIRKLKLAGADSVISPAGIAGRLIAKSALTGEDIEELVKEGKQVQEEVKDQQKTKDTDVEEEAQEGKEPDEDKGGNGDGEETGGESDDGDGDGSGGKVEGMHRYVSGDDVEEDDGEGGKDDSDGSS
ncbi:MAG: NAD-binding protein [Halobacteria archaeon]